MGRAERRAAERAGRGGLWVPPGMRGTPPPEVKQMDTSGPQLRLVRCTDCKSIEELPDFEGNPANDVLLDDLLTKSHIYASGTTHEVALIKVPERLWRDDKVRPRIVEQLSAGASKGLDEFDADHYATRDTYREEALKCFDRHHRPKGADCLDYRDQSKRLGNPTSEGWKTGPRVFLCQFCPVQTQVDRAKRGELASG